MTHFSFHSPRDLPLAKSDHFTSLIPHVKTLHCPVNGCGKLFKKQEDLERHRAFHSKEKLSEGQTPSKLIPFSTKSCDTTSTLESTIKHEEGCNNHHQQLLANRQELMSAIEHSRNSLNLINTQLTQLGSMGTTQESLLGKRPNGYAEDPQEVDRLIKIAVIENDGLKKKLIVARATIAAFYKQLVFLESFLPRQN
jgi:hypothetical protein